MRTRFARLDVGRIKHNSNPTAHGLRRQVALESAAHYAVAAMRTADLSPLDAELLAGRLLAAGRLGDKGDLLAAVELGVAGGVDVLDFDEGDVLVLIPLSSLVAEDGSLYVEARWALGGGCLGHLIRA